MASTNITCVVAKVFCDRHYGGINYPRGGVGRIAELLVEGLQERGSYVEYKANASLLPLYCLEDIVVTLVIVNSLGSLQLSGEQMPVQSGRV